MPVPPPFAGSMPPPPPPPNGASAPIPNQSVWIYIIGVQGECWRGAPPLTMYRDTWSKIG